MRRESSSPDAYCADVERPQRELLDAVREVIREVAPEIREGIGYGMLDYPGLANLAAQKNYVALYVAPAVLARRREDFPGVNMGKSCLRFRRMEQIDREAIAALLREVREFRRQG